jgi:DNA polymerase III delta prime subunit
MKEIWYKKYRPENINEYVFHDPQLKEKVQEWIDTKNFPSLILLGQAGSGKSTLANLLAKRCDFDESDIQYISASVTNGVDDIRDKVIRFAERSAFGLNGRLVILDEADYLSPNAQAALRNIIGEFDNVRFILIGNYPHKIIPALKSRCLPIIFNEMNREQFVERLVNILVKENVKFEIDTVIAHYNAHYPDLRKAINSMEAMVSNNTLGMPISDTSTVSDWMNYAIVYFESGDIEKARKHILDNITYEDYEFFYEYLYKNIDVFANGDNDKRDACIIAIADSLAADMQVANREINLSACLAKLTRISKK